jgi:MFS family permease
MSTANDGPRDSALAWKHSPWLPAALLILIQVFSGMRDLPQYTFFVIFLQENMQLQPFAISSIVAGAQVAGMITALLGGLIGARLGSKWVWVAGLACLGMSSFAFQAPTLWLAAACWFLSGAGTALAAVGGASFLTQISSRGGLGLLAAFYALSVTAGGALGNPLAGFLIESYGYATFSNVLMLLSAGLILAAALLLPRYENSSSQKAAAGLLFSNILNTTRQTNVRFLIGMRSFPTIFYGMLTVLIPLMLNQVTGSKVTVAAYGTVNLVVASLAQLLVGRAADRWGARIPTAAAYTGLIIAGVGLALSSSTQWGLFGFGVLGIASAWALSTLMYIWVNDGIAKPEHPATFGLLHSIWSLSMISGSVLGGWFVATIPSLPFLTGAALSVAAISLVLRYYQHNQPEQADPANLTNL